MKIVLPPLGWLWRWLRWWDGEGFHVGLFWGCVGGVLTGRRSEKCMILDPRGSKLLHERTLKMLYDGHDENIPVLRGMNARVETLTVYSNSKSTWGTTQPQSLCGI